MSTIIFDMGSGNICRNNRDKISEMIYSVAGIDKDRHRIVFKWQLFTKKTVPYLEPLNHIEFEYAYKLAEKLGYQTTSSVFDDESLEFLQTHFDVPFIKIACNQKYYPLMWHIKPEIDKVVSIDNGDNIHALYDMYEGMHIDILCCVSDYPAPIDEYKMRFPLSYLENGVSDHTIGMDIWNRYRPTMWEVHFIPEHGVSDDPYGDMFCKTPEELKAVL